MKKNKGFYLMMLFCCMTAGCRQSGGWKPADTPLGTRWTKKVSPENVHPEYPRPQMVREQWMNLNGLWDFDLTDLESAGPGPFARRILVPFPVESALSGIGERVGAGRSIWYRRNSLLTNCPSASPHSGMMR